MAFDPVSFKSKINAAQKHLGVSTEQIALGTGMDAARLASLQEGASIPTGDEILILADYFKCDFEFFIKDGIKNPFEQSNILFRRYSGELNSEDRIAIQELLYLCETEAFLQQELNEARSPFVFVKQGTYFKAHGIEAAKSYRAYLGLSANQLPLDVFLLFQKTGLHVFRRKLSNSTISGLFIRDKKIGSCILVNYDEDIYRQRFTVAHEVGHAILDDGDDFGLSLTRWSADDLSEVRASNFASFFLIPESFREVLANVAWDADSAVEWASKLKVSTGVLAIALKQWGCDEQICKRVKEAQVPRSQKEDAELPASMSPTLYAAKKDMLERGLSPYYVKLSFRAYHEGAISKGKLAECLFLTEIELERCASLYGVTLTYGT